MKICEDKWRQVKLQWLSSVTLSWQAWYVSTLANRNVPCSTCLVLQSSFQRFQFGAMIKDSVILPGSTSQRIRHYSTISACIWKIKEKSTKNPFHSISLTFSAFPSPFVHPFFKTLPSLHHTSPFTPHPSLHTFHTFRCPLHPSICRMCVSLKPILADKKKRWYESVRRLLWLVTCSNEMFTWSTWLCSSV